MHTVVLDLRGQGIPIASKFDEIVICRAAVEAASASNWEKLVNALSAGGQSNKKSNTEIGVHMVPSDTLEDTQKASVDNT